jgi:UDP-N-acetylmuramyl tripeptide synthase
MKIISVTGTKGKTTVIRALDFVLRKSGDKTLRVDTDGHYINGKQKSTLEDSKKLFMLVPTVCPGKYLLDARKMYPDFTAVFETAIGSSASAGLGYGLHQIGIFTNILEDHLKASKRLQTRGDLARAKRFIFNRIDVEGTVIFNADDKYVCSQIKAVPKFRKPVYFLPVGFDFKYFDIKAHLKKGGEYLTVEKDFVVIKSEKETAKIINIQEIIWTFKGQFQPSVFNLMFIVAGLYVHNKGKITKKNKKYLKQYRFDKFGGRLTLLENKKKGIKILVDYAHEKFSLEEVAKLGKTIAKNKIIGVVRLAPDRQDEIIYETGEYIANKYDNLIVYDKIDGVVRKEYKGRKSFFNREIGEVSKILYKGIKENKKKGEVERVIREDLAIKRASEVAQNGDVVVVICGDDHRRTIKLVQKYFKAKFV